MLETLIIIAIVAAVWSFCAIPEPIKTVGWVIIGAVALLTLVRLLPAFG